MAEDKKKLTDAANGIQNIPKLDDVFKFIDVSYQASLNWLSLADRLPDNRYKTENDKNLILDELIIERDSKTGKVRSIVFADKDSEQIGYYQLTSDFEEDNVRSITLNKLVISLTANYDIKSNKLVNFELYYPPIDLKIKYIVIKGKKTTRPICTMNGISISYEETQIILGKYITISISMFVDDIRESTMRNLKRYRTQAPSRIEKEDV